MNLRSPIIAILWENWRLTRVEAAQRLVLSIVLASIAMIVFDAGPTIAYWILISIHCCYWISIAKLNGGRLADGYRPGFPFYLLYTRPVRTSVAVGVAMAYDAIACTVLYLGSAVLLGFVFGQSFPLLSVILWFVAFHAACACIQWSTRNRVVQWVGSIAIGWPLFGLLVNRVSSLQVEFLLVENAAMILICIASFFITVAGVSRQRRGDAVASVPRAARSDGFPEWLVTLFRFPCPTVSATRAQVWFELKSSGIPVMAIGGCVAALIFVLFPLSSHFAPARFAAVGVTILSIPFVLFTLGSNAFNIRRKQGRMYASAFEATLPYSTVRLAGVKVLVRAASTLVALFAIGASIWISSSHMSSWGQWLPDGTHDALPKLLLMRSKVEDAVAGLAGYGYVALAFIAACAVTERVAWQAAREALKARYPSALFTGGTLLVVSGLAIVLLALATRDGKVSMVVAGTIFRATFWISGAAMLFATIYLLWSGFAQRALGIAYVCGTLLISAAFAAAWFAGMNATDVAGILWFALMFQMSSILAPWALNHVRHV